MYVDAIPIPMLTAAVTADTVSDPVPLNNTKETWHSATFSSLVTSGGVVVEFAPTKDYAGVWEIINTFDPSAGLVQQFRHEGSGGFVRHRVSPVIGGTTPTVTSVCRRTQYGR